MRLWRKRSRKDATDNLWPDEVFLDATNIPGFERERFEGVIERPLSKASFYAFGIFLMLFGFLMFGRSFWLQVVRGSELAQRAQSNYIEKTFIEPPRGIIYDRRGIPIVANEAFTDDKGIIQYRRKARHAYAYSQLLGYVGKITEEDLVELDKKIPGIVEIGKSGLEERYNDLLQGKPGEHDEEIDAQGRKVSEGLVVPPKEGNNITTAIHADLQEVFWTKLEETMRERGFRGGAGIIFDVKTGEVLSLVNAPSFDLDAFSRGLTQEEAKSIFQDPRSPLYNRAIAGTYAPGSIMKPYVALAALEEGVIDPLKNIYSSGALTLPNPYNPSKPSIFRDWKAHGYVDMRRALAVSSDVYFYTVGGGFEDVRGLGITKIKEWYSKFGFGSPTGIDLYGERKGTLPDPEWKAKIHPKDPTWRIGDTYHISIGQGDLLVTPAEVARGLGLIALKGKEVPLHLLKQDPTPPKQVLNIADKNWKVVQEGMLQATEAGGTAAALSWLPFDMAGKTGTAEIGNKDRVNSWFIGYGPYEDPKIGMVIFLESGSRTNLVGASFVASETFRWIMDQGGIDVILSTDR